MCVLSVACAYAHACFAHVRGSVRLGVCLCNHAHVRLRVRAGLHAGMRAYDYYNLLFVTRPRQGENNNNELLQCLFFDDRSVVPDERLIC